MPVTEDETVAAVPPDGWIRRYVIHAMKQTTSPLIYHLGTGVATMGVTCPLSYGMHYAGVLRSNSYCLLVGRSGEDNKSSALNIGREVLDAAASGLIGEYPGSAEGLVQSLAAAPSQIIPISEFGKFLSDAQGGYFEKVKTLITDAWDCGSIQRVRANNNNTRVENPRLSINAACSIPYLEKHTLAEDWTGGFMGRWMVFYGQRERVDPDPVGDRTDFDWLVDNLRTKATAPSAGWCMGLDHVAKMMWNEWYYDVSDRKLPSNIIGIRARAPTICRKICLVYGWDFGPAAYGDPWEITPEILEPAIKLTELHIKSLIDLSSIIAEHHDARQRRAVIQALEARGGIATLGEILSIMKTKKRTALEVLDALIEEKRVSITSTSIGQAYTLVSDNLF